MNAQTPLIKTVVPIAPEEGAVGIEAAGYAARTVELLAGLLLGVIKKARTGARADLIIK